MPGVPDREELRATLAGFDDRQRKVVGGMMAVLFGNPERVREREWVTEQFTQVVLLAGDLGDVGGSHDGVDAVREYVERNVDPLLNACYGLFLVVADDLAPVAGQAGQAENGATLEDAMVRALSYFAPPTG